MTYAIPFPWESHATYGTRGNFRELLPCNSIHSEERMQSTYVRRLFHNRCRPSFLRRACASDRGYSLRNVRTASSRSPELSAVYITSDSIATSHARQNNILLNTGYRLGLFPGLEPGSSSSSLNKLKLYFKARVLEQRIFYFLRIVFIFYLI